MSERPTAHVVLKYTLFQVPGTVLVGLVLLALVRWLDLPFGAAGLVLGLWLLKDVMLFPVLWRSYADAPAATGRGPIGATGEVRERLDPAGRVALGGALWQAEAVAPPLEVGARVRVVEVRGLTVVVASAPAEEAQAEDQAEE